ncbi:peptide/nickel transport system substrate-binding protein [Litoreibacter meonggei]|uniref:Peptide/nickel transport system substrate-binding protein n=1 Tax=Litoreibacter meonggei TaxID=1049199 RepID=A0A497VHX6_9RHOB|nr:extracellular solute-binding protein [Litoreibacter meonggei]RLJ41847.1 peptide/nickel transport system substrate-binding protein [Litoreibacter meonggei]
MKSNYFQTMRNGLASAAILAASTAFAEPQHGIAMYGDPALPPDFVSLPYANADAPKGGKIVTGEVGGFDSLNPHIRKGRVPWQLRFLAYESLMGRSWDEPFTLYGLLAETVETDSTNLWVEFKLRPEARFSDGSPVTAEDVIWSYETLGTKGHPRYAGSWAKIETSEVTPEGKIRFTFKEPDRELALIMGMRPILKKAQWDGASFEESGLDTIPISSAPYVIDDFEAGRFVSLKRNPDYWGSDVPFQRGTNNIDELRMEFYGDATAMFEAFKAGELNTIRETSTAKWAQQYDFPRVTNGQVVKSEIPHQRPTGMNGFVMNTRRDIFKDWRVREAMLQAFNYEFIDEKLNGEEGLPRIASYFHNSVLAMENGEATGKVAELLEPYKTTLLPGTYEGYTLPTGNGSARNRAGIREASRLLEEAGWVVKDGVLTGPDGHPFVFDILLKQGSAEHQSIANIYKEHLERLGVFPTITVVDSAQYRERTDAYDFDMTHFIRGLSLSPGNEQMSYWGSDGVVSPGSRNLMGMNSPAAEAMIQTMLTSESQEDYRAAVKALDRILTAGRYVVPLWYSNVSMLAHDANLKFPDTLPVYGDWIGFQPDVWWSE